MLSSLLRSYRHSGQTDNIHHCCCECHQCSQFIEESAEPEVNDNCMPLTSLLILCPGQVIELSRSNPPAVWQSGSDGTDQCISLPRLRIGPSLSRPGSVRLPAFADISGREAIAVERAALSALPHAEGVQPGDRRYR